MPKATRIQKANAGSISNPENGKPVWFRWVRLLLFGFSACVAANWLTRDWRLPESKVTLAEHIIQTKGSVGVSTTAFQDVPQGMVRGEDGKFIMEDSSSAVWPDVQPAHRVFVTRSTARAAGPVPGTAVTQIPGCRTVVFSLSSLQKRSRNGA